MFYYKKVDKYEEAEAWIHNNLNSDELIDQVNAHGDLDVMFIVKLRIKGLSYEAISIQMCLTEASIKSKWNLFRCHIYGYLQGKNNTKF